MVRLVGSRVGALLSGDEKQVRLIGYGVYAGEEVPVEAAGWIAEMLRDMKHPNPKIQLDSGKVVYGCECWWDGEEETKKAIADREVVNVDIDEVRREYANSADKEGK